MSPQEISLAEAKDADPASERRMRDFAEAASDWFWEVGPDLRFTYASDRLKEATGVAPHELLGRSVEEFLSASPDSEGAKRQRDVMRERRPFRDFVIPYRTRAGWSGHMRISGVPILADDGSFLGYRGCAADITAEIETRAAAKRSDTLLRDAIESLSEGFTLYDADERLVLCNSRYRDMYGMIKDALVPGTRIEELLQLVAQRRQVQFASAQAWVSERLRQFRNPGRPFEQVLNDGRHLRCTDYRTATGGTICLRTDITDIKRAEQRFRDAIGSMPDGFALFDPLDRLVLCNERFRDVYRYMADADDLTGREFRDLMRPLEEGGIIELPEGESPKAWFARRLLHHEASPEQPFLLHFKDGRHFEVHERRTAEGGCVSTYIDITDRRRAEIALRESRDGLERAQKIGRIGSITVDLTTGKSVWSAQQYRLLGLDPAAGGGSFDLFLSRVHPDDRRRLIDERAGYVHGREPRSFEYRIVLPDGETRWARREAEIERDAAGRALILHAATQDITESKCAAQELIATQELLKENEARYRSFFETSMDALFLTAPDGSIIEVNAAACEMLGRSAQEIRELGRDGVVDVSDPRLQAALQERARSGRVRAEFAMIRADGTKFPVETATAVFVDAAGRQMTAMSSRDLTERKRLEAQLAQTQKMEALGTLAGGIAHDLNNTLVPILVFTKLVMGSLSEASAEREHLLTVIEATKRAKDLVEQILTFSRSETTERTPIDLAHIVGEALKMVRAGTSPTIDLQTDITSDRLPILGNPTQIQQVVMNLCSNAAHAVAGKAGKITVILGAERGRDDHASDPAQAGYATLSVIDNGVGMNEATRQRIFDPFFTTKGVGEGTGLGLAIVHGVVRAHGGSITVESHVGSGTRFDLSFPLIADDKAEGA